MKNLYLQKCISDDWKMLQQISIETFTNTYHDKNDSENINRHLQHAFNEIQLKKELTNPNCHFYFLIKKEKELLGYLKLNEFESQSEPMPEDHLEIERIYLLEKYQGKGLGRKMIEFSIEKAIQKKKKKIWLGVWEKNPKAISFYEKMGFEKTGTHLFKVGDDEQLDYVMTMKTG